MRNYVVWLAVKQSGLQVHPRIRWLGRVDSNSPWMFLHTGERPPVKERRGLTKCAVYHCRRVVAARTQSIACSHCKMTRWRINHPAQAAFATIRDRAKKKRIEFALTFEQFLSFLTTQGEGYLDGRGRCVGCLHLDRIDATKGYTEGNLQILSAQENSRKGACEDKKAKWLADRLRTATSRRWSREPVSKPPTDTEPF